MLRRRTVLTGTLLGATVAALLFLSTGIASADSLTPIASFDDPRDDMPTRSGQLVRARYGPYTIAANSEIHNAFNFSAPAPCTNCRITDIVPNLVYNDGTPANLENGAMLHHFVFLNPEREDVTCPGGGAGSLGERFFAAGNERSHVHLPTPYGYDNTRANWGLIYHLVNKSSVSKTVNIEVVYRYRPVAETQPATPVWLDIDNCGDSEYTAANGYSDVHSSWTSTLEGRILGLGGHLHDVDITNDEPCVVHCEEKGFGLATTAEIVGGPSGDYFGPQPPNNAPPSDLTGATACRSEGVYGSAWAGTQWNGHLDTMSYCGVTTSLPAGAQADAYPPGSAFPTGGYPLLSGQVIRVHSEYENNTGQPQTDVMGIMVGWIDHLSCDGVKATRIGTSGNDNLTGTAGNDVIVGLGGNDTISGLNGNDKACGGAGNDTFTGGTGNDSFTGGSGADTFNGNAGSDTAFYSDRRAGVTVTLNGSANDGNSADGPANARDNMKADVENVTGGAGGDSLTGNASQNTFDGGDGADTMIGLGGIDTASYANRIAGVTVDIDGAADDGGAADGPAGVRDNVRTDVENLIGGRGPDRLTGNATASNTLDGRNGADSLSGLGGTDTVTYALRIAGVTVDIDGVADDGNSADGGSRDNVRPDVEYLIGGKGADTLTGSNAANRITGGLGADSMFGLNGNDALFANDGVADTQINCAGGAADVAHVDGPDPSPVGCETVGP